MVHYLVTNYLALVYITDDDINKITQPLSPSSTEGVRMAFAAGLCSPTPTSSPLPTVLICRDVMMINC